MRKQAPDRDIPEILKDRSYLQELAGYYKWVVSLALFVLTVSLSLAGIFRDGLKFQWLFIAGWLLLGLCTFQNWMLVKRLVSLPIVLNAPEADQGLHHQIFLTTLPLIKKYGFIQNWAFLVGVGFIGVGFALNVVNL